MWFYNEKEVTKEIYQNYCDLGFIGFVYEITDLSNGKKYIGKKIWLSKRKLPPLKGKTRKRTKIVETDWRDYFGSSETVKQLVEEKGKDTFRRQIVRLCKTKSEMNYYEAQRQFETECLLHPEKYYNEFIGCKINRKTLLTKTKK